MQVKINLNVYYSVNERSEMTHAAGASREDRAAAQGVVSTRQQTHHRDSDLPRLLGSRSVISSVHTYCQSSHSIRYSVCQTFGYVNFVTGRHVREALRISLNDPQREELPAEPRIAQVVTYWRQQPEGSPEEGVMSVSKRRWFLVVNGKLNKLIMWIFRCTGLRFGLWLTLCTLNIHLLT